MCLHYLNPESHRAVCRAPQIWHAWICTYNIVNLQATCWCVWHLKSGSHRAVCLASQTREPRIRIPHLKILTYWHGSSGKRVNVSLQGAAIFADERCVALSLQLSEEQEKNSCAAAPHITLWAAKGTPNKYAGELVRISERRIAFCRCHNHLHAGQSFFLLCCQYFKGRRCFFLFMRVCKAKMQPHGQLRTKWKTKLSGTERGMPIGPRDYTEHTLARTCCHKIIRATDNQRAHVEEYTEKNCVQVCTRTRLFTHTPMYVHAYTNTHSLTHAHIHTHTHSRRSRG